MADAMSDFTRSEGLLPLRCSADWPRPDVCVVRLAGALDMATTPIVAEYLRDAATEDGIARLKQRRAIEERLAEPESPSPTGEDSRAALQQELLRLDLADRAGPRVVRRGGAAVDRNRNLRRPPVCDLPVIGLWPARWKGVCSPSGNHGGP